MSRLPRLPSTRKSPPVRASSLMLASALALATVPAPSPGDAQTVLRRALPPGPLSGLELDLEGPLRVRPGERARWFVVGHEIFRDRDLRAARGATLQVFASYEPSRPVAELTLDERGRGAVEVEIPATLPGRFTLYLDLRVDRSRMSRRFSIGVEVDRSRQLSLEAPQLTTGAGVGAEERVGVLGRLTDGLGAGLSGERVSMGVFEGSRLVGPPLAIRTSEDGRFHAVLEAPRAAAAPLRIVARHRPSGDEAPAEVEASLPLTLREPAPATLDLRAKARRDLLGPREVVEVDVFVRDARGVGVAGATIEGPAVEGDEPERATTDARGLATLRARAPARLGDGELRFSVLIPGLARADAAAAVRVTNGRPTLRAVVEGGALLLGVPSRVFARAVGPDGAPLAQRVLTLRLGDQTARATTDAAGVAALDLTLPFAPGDLDAPDACGGGTAIEARLALEGDGRATQALCLPLDPDGVVRARATHTDGGARVDVVRRADARAMPVALTLLERRGGAFVPIAERVLAPTESTATLTAAGLHPFRYVRARALTRDGVPAGSVAGDPASDAGLELRRHGP
ncbi:MAG: hypothetical protein KF901_31345 [Myxococcales bacterium]|nr:hypothetical protein [Myxococcales bacterium]